ncbi:MAG: Fe-S cluster assembly protein SufD [Alphaproteobacteria bacterium]
MSLPTPLGDVETRFIADYDAAKESLPGASLPWLTDLREKGIAALKARGLPHKRVEEWKYTDLKARLSRPLPLGAAPSRAAVEAAEGQDPFAALEAVRLVFVDGLFQADASDLDGLPGGVTVTSLARAMDEGQPWLEGHIGGVVTPGQHPVYGLNLALSRDGAAVRIAEGVALDRPIHLVFVASSAAAETAAHMRNLVVVEAGARARLLESHLGLETGARMATVGTDIRLAQEADLLHVKALADRGEGVHVGGTFVAVKERARYEGFAVTTGGAVTRNEVHIRFDGTHAFARASGASMLVGRQHCDNTTVIDHALPDCESHETFKNVLADRARGVFQGKIIVRQDAQRTDGYQLSQALLLNAGAEADTKPELEIFADDVKCSHGATVGELDAESIFYLRARGIPEADAKALLIRAFVGEVLDEIADEAIRDALGAHVDQWLVTNRDAVAAAEAGLFDDGLGDTDAA